MRQWRKYWSFTQNTACSPIFSAQFVSVFILFCNVEIGYAQIEYSPQLYTNYYIKNPSYWANFSRIDTLRSNVNFNVFKPNFSNNFLIKNYNLDIAKYFYKRNIAIGLNFYRENFDFIRGEEKSSYAAIGIAKTLRLDKESFMNFGLDFQYWNKTITSFSANLTNNNIGINIQHKKLNFGITSVNLLKPFISYNHNLDRQLNRELLANVLYQFSHKKFSLIPNFNLINYAQNYTFIAGARCGIPSLFMIGWSGKIEDYYNEGTVQNSVILEVKIGNQGIANYSYSVKEGMFGELHTHQLILIWKLAKDKNDLGAIY